MAGCPCDELRDVIEVGALEKVVNRSVILSQAGLKNLIAACPLAPVCYPGRVIRFFPLLIRLLKDLRRHTVLALKHEQVFAHRFNVPHDTVERHPTLLLELPLDSGL